MRITRFAKVLSLAALVSLAVWLPRIDAAETDAVQRLLDQAEIDAMLTRYTHALDTLDADAYVGVFTNDAVFELGGGEVRRGHDEIRSIITERQAPETAPSVLMHHVVTNSTLEFVADDEVRHVGYWMTIVGNVDDGFTVPAMGHYEDVIVRRDGRWLIRSRKLVLPPAP